MNSACVLTLSLLLYFVESAADSNRTTLGNAVTQPSAPVGEEACDDLDDNPPGPPDEAVSSIANGLSSSNGGDCQWVIGAIKGGKRDGCRRWELFCGENSTVEKGCNDSSRVWHECSYDVPLGCAFLGVFHNPVHHRYDRQPCGRPRCQCRPGLIYEPKDDSCGLVDKLCGPPNGRVYLSNFALLNYTALNRDGAPLKKHAQLLLNVPEYKREFHFVLTEFRGDYVGYDSRTLITLHKLPLHTQRGSSNSVVPGSNITAWVNKGHLHEGVVKYPDGAVYYIRDGDMYIGRVDLALLGVHSVLYTQRDVVDTGPPEIYDYIPSAKA